MSYISLNNKKNIIKSILYQLKQKNITPILTIQSKTDKNSLISIVLKNNINSIAILRSVCNKRYNKAYINFSWSLINEYFIKVIFFEDKEFTIEPFPNFKAKP